MLTPAEWRETLDKHLPKGPSREDLDHSRDAHHIALTLYMHAGDDNIVSDVSHLPPAAPGDLLGARAADLPIYASRELHDPDPRSWAILLFSGLMRLLSPRRPSAAGTPALARAGLALILGGTDRAAVGYVVDFVVSTWRTRRSRWGRSR